jgi:hypothetical protein
LLKALEKKGYVWATVGLNAPEIEHRSGNANAKQ